MSAGPYERLLRWYPSQWRSRYGDEMAAFLEDSYGSAEDVPPRAQLGLVRAGLSERVRATGLIGSAPDETRRLRAASLLVLTGWAFFLVAIAIFGKVTDNWFNDSPAGGRWVASSGYNGVTVTAAVGCGVVLVAVAMALPSLVRLLRGGGWHRVRAPIVGAVVSALVAASLLAVAVAWAHQLSAHDRNGGLPVYGAFFLTVSLCIVVALGVGTWAVIAVARQLELSAARLRFLARLALALTGVMLLAFVGLIVWWVSEALHAPGVLLGGIGNGVPYTSATVPPTLAAAGLLMVCGLVLAALGSTRIAATKRSAPAPT